MLSPKALSFAIQQTAHISAADIKTQKIELCNLLREADPSLSIRDISKITKIPPTSVSRYLQNGGILNE